MAQAATKRTYQLSTAERARRAAQKRLRDAKKKAQQATKKAETKRKKARDLESTIGRVEKAIKGADTAVIDMGDISVLPSSVSDLVGDSEVVFQANPGPQEEFLSAGERDVLYGGAAGGGKSFALLADPLRYCHNPNHMGSSSQAYPRRTNRTN